MRLASCRQPGMLLVAEPGAGTWPWGGGGGQLALGSEPDVSAFRSRLKTLRFLSSWERNVQPGASSLSRRFQHFLHSLPFKA